MHKILYILSIFLIIYSCDDSGTGPHQCLSEVGDQDNDGICDDADDCIGEYDCAGLCNGNSDCGFTFVNDIIPIFNTYNCYGCHGNSGGINLLTYQNVISGGNSGPGVDMVNFNEQQSTIWLRTNDGSMPPSGSMSSSDVNKIKSWINQGAIYE